MLRRLIRWLGLVTETEVRAIAEQAARDALKREIADAERELERREP